MPEIGDSLGRYTLLKRLAAGGMGEVYLAAKPGPVGFGPRVALKILRDELASDPQFVDMLVDEANISMFLNHQNVVSVLDLSEDAGRYYIAMEYVQGLTVEQLLDRLNAQGRRLDLSLGLYVATELCRALKYAHTRVNHTGEPLNIVHRDVTPANILLSTQGEVKLTDFGIARAKGRIHQTQAGVLKGKFGYMAPEMIRYEQIDARADIFCAGVVLYLMFTMKHPVAGATIMEAITRYEDKQIPKPSQISPDVPAVLDAIVMRALEPKVEHRWASAAALSAALQDAILKNATWRRETQEGAQRISELLRSVSPDAFADPIPADVSERLLRQSQQNGRAHKADEPRSAIRDASTGRTDPPAGRRPPPSQPPPGKGTVRADNGRHDASAETKLPTAPRPPAREPSGLTTDPNDELVAAESFNQSTHDSSIPSFLAESTESGADALAFGQTDALSMGRTETLSARSDPLGQSVTNPDLETEEGLHLADVYAARDALLNEHSSKLGPDTLSGEEDEATELPPRRKDAASGVEVVFPDSSTDRHRMREGLLDEPSLPREEGTARSALDDGRTVIGMQALPTPITPEPATRAGLDADETGRGASDPALLELELPVPRKDSGGNEDGATIAGVVLAEVNGAPGPITPSGLDPERTRAYSAVDVTRGRGDEDSETIVPPGYAGGIEVRTVPDPSEGNDQTLLDGMDAKMVQEALEKQRQAQRSAARPAAKPDKKSKSDPGSVRSDARPAAAKLGEDFDMDRIVADSVRTGKHASFDPAKSPPLVNGPVRIVVGQEGAQQKEESGPAAKRPVVVPATNTRPKKVDSPAQGSVAAPEVGAATGRWIKGELDPAGLSWDDDAAARRAVATRNAAPGKPAPAPARGPAASVPPSATPALTSGPVPQQAAPTGVRYVSGGMITADGRFVPTTVPPTTGGRGWMPIVAAIAAVVAVGVLGAALFFTQVLWPKLKLTTQPPGASVTVDERVAAQSTPLVVKVEPGRSHVIEFRMEGYRPERKEISSNVARLRSYTLDVPLRRLLTEIFIPTEASVVVNGQVVGKGTRVLLPELPLDQPVQLKVEAPGHRTWEQNYERAGLLPESIDVVLRAEAQPPPAPKPPQPRK